MATNSGAIRAGRAFVEIFADSNPLKRGLRTAGLNLQSFGKQVTGVGLGIAGLGAAGLAGLGALSKQFADMGDAVAKAAARMSISVEALSELQFAASQSGASAEDLEKGIRRMQGILLDAEQGLSTATDALDLLGLSLSELQGQTPEEQFKLFAESISTVEDPSRRAALAMEIFGRSGTKLLPLFANGRAGIEQLQEKAREFGITMETEDARAAERWTDAMDTLTRGFKSRFFQAMAALEPLLTDVATRLGRAVASTAEWIKENRNLLVVAVKALVGITALGGAIAAVGLAITAAGLVLTSLATAVGFLLSPVGLLIAAIVGGTVAFLRFTETGRALTGVVTETFGAIVAAIQSGNIQAATDVLWAGLRLAWAEGTVALREAWIGFTGELAKVFLGLDTTIRSIWEELVGFIQSKLFQAVAAIAPVISDLLRKVGKESDAIAIDAIGFGAGVAGGLTESQTAQRVTDIEAAGAAARALVDEQTAGRLTALTEGVASARQAFEDAVAAARAADAAAPVEASRPGTPAAAAVEGLRSNARASSGALNTASIVGTQSAFNDVVRALGGAARGVSPGDRFIAEAIDRLNAAEARRHRESQRSGEPLKVERAT